VVGWRIGVNGWQEETNAHFNRGLSFFVINFHIGSAESLTLSRARL